jgi:hypothetical protein
LDFAAGLEFADPGGEVQVLGGGVTLPFVLAGEGACAACKGEDTNEGAGVGACDVALKSYGVFEGSVVAGLAGKLAFGLGDVLGRAGALGWGRRDFGGGTLAGSGGLGSIFIIGNLFGDDDVLVNVTFSIGVGI